MDKKIEEFMRFEKTKFDKISDERKLNFYNLVIDYFTNLKHLLPKETEATTPVVPVGKITLMNIQEANPSGDKCIDEIYNNIIGIAKKLNELILHINNSQPHDI